MLMGAILARKVARSTLKSKAVIMTSIAATRSVASASNADSKPSPWGVIPMGPPDPILGLTEAFKKDTAEKKARGANNKGGWIPNPLRLLMNLDIDE